MRRSNLDPDRDFEYQQAGGRAAIQQAHRLQQSAAGRVRLISPPRNGAQDNVMITAPDNGANGAQAGADIQKLAILRIALIAAALL